MCHIVLQMAMQVIQSIVYICVAIDPFEPCHDHAVFPIYLIAWVCNIVLQMDMYPNQTHPIAFVWHVIHVNLVMAMQSLQSI